jgi:hypothetical protein
VIAYAANDRVEDSGKRNTGQQERSTTGEVNQRNGDKPTGDGDGGDCKWYPGGSCMGKKR